MSTLEIYKTLYEDCQKEINRLRTELHGRGGSDKSLYEVDDEITIWDTPEGPKTSVKTKIVRGIRLL